MPRLQIYIDFKSPAAYLAMKPTRALLRAHKVTAQWLPVQTRQRALANAREDETRTETHFRVREAARRATHLHYAKVQGIEMTFPPEPGNTDLALAALLCVQTDPLPFIEQAFHAYWVQQENLNEERTVQRLLEQAGAEAASFRASDATARLDEATGAAAAAGAIDAPAYVVDGQLFIGREHLPWISQLLDG